MKIKPVLAGAAMLLGTTTFAFAPEAGAVVGVPESPYCYTLVSSAQKDGTTIDTITVYDADGDVVVTGASTDPAAYDKAKQTAAGLPECAAAETPIVDPAVALMGLAVAIPAGILVKRRRSGAAA